MDIATILVKLTGLILLLWTIRSIYQHFKQWKKQAKEAGANQQSFTEELLNSLLLYVWLAFMIVFSGGMILNN